MSVDYTAVLLYGFKLTPEEVEKIGVDKIFAIKEKYEMLPTPVGIIRDDDYTDACNWYVGRWIEQSSVSYESEDFSTMELLHFKEVVNLMDELFEIPCYAMSKREDDSLPVWHLFTRCW